MSTFRAFIRNGELVLPPRFKEWARQQSFAALEIEHVKPERTLSELRMYRAWLHGVAEQTGNDESELHEFLIDRCAPTVATTIRGSKGSVEVERKKRTSGGHSLTMDKHEMSEFMQRCSVLTGYPLPTDEQLAEMGYVKGAGPKNAPEYPKEGGNLADKF